jgi:GTP cyclohydrolase-4
MSPRDVHYDSPDVTISVRRVGVTGIRVPIQFVFFEEKPAIVVPTFDVFVDLPAFQKGIHPSRNIEATVEIVGQYAHKQYWLEDLCANIAQEQLQRHEYAKEAEVRASADVVYDRATPKSNIQTYESCTMKAKAIAIREGKKQHSIRKWIGVTVSGITACPCAQEMLRGEAETKLVKEFKIEESQAKHIAETLPIGSHMQRSYGSLMIEIPQDFKINALQLVDIVEQSMSASTYELMKRPDEACVVQTALNNPKFVEDAIRHMVKNVVEAFPNLPDEMELTLEQRNEECIHRHDLVALETLNMGEARQQIINKNYDTK